MSVSGHEYESAIEAALPAGWTILRPDYEKPIRRSGDEFVVRLTRVRFPELAAFHWANVVAKIMFGIHNVADGTDLAEYEAANAREALAIFLADTDDAELNPDVIATPQPLSVQPSPVNRQRIYR
jgi:hypothetical protein